MEAGRLMLQKNHQLIKEQVDFAFETTLATRSYVSLIKNVKAKGDEVILLYYWLSSPTFAKIRVASRVAEGGHHIPSDVIERRYYRGIHNLTKLYIPICDNWLVIDNMTVAPETIALGAVNYQQITNIQLQHPTALMRNKETQLPELSDKVMSGMRKAMCKLVETSAAQNKNLVVGDKEGNPISVPAKDLLKSLQ